MQKFIILFLIVLVVFPLAIFARIGVGVGTGEIKMDKTLKPGGIYELPSLVVFNTGDESSDYEVGIAYHAERTQLKPPKAWFNFDPVSFYLEPGKSQVVQIKLALPVKTTPGDYFAYLQSQPISKAGPGTTAGVAVGTRLFFTVAPANIFQAVTFRVSSFWTTYSPWTWVVLGMVLAAILIVIFKKKFAFQLGVKKK